MFDLHYNILAASAVLHCSNLATARLPLNCTLGLQIKKLFILSSLSSSCCLQQVQFSGHSRTLWSFPILITRSKNWSTAGYRRAKWALRWFETVRHFSLQPPELGKVYCTLCCELLVSKSGKEGSWLCFWVGNCCQPTNCAMCIFLPCVGTLF